MFGRLVKYTGRIFVFIVGGVINYAMIILMFLWNPQPGQLIILFVIAGFWGTADAIWQTQVIGNLFRYLPYTYNKMNDRFIKH